MAKDEYKLGQSKEQRQGGPAGPGMGGVTEKSKDFTGTWGKLLNYCKEYWVAVIVALVSAVAGTILTILGPDKLSDLTNVITEGIVTGIDMDAVVKIGVTLIVFYALSLILSTVQGWIMATVTQRVSKKLRRDISSKINRLPMWYYNRTSTGDILSRVTNDVDTIGQSLNQSVGTLVSAITLLIGRMRRSSARDSTKACSPCAWNRAIRRGA